MKTWDILIPSIASRTERLTLLLKELETQISAGHHWNVGVHVFRDNINFLQSWKSQALLESSHADYVSFIEDDDWVDPDYIRSIDEAIQQDPDFVGFGLRFTEDGVLQMPIIHSYFSVQNEIREDEPRPEVLYRRVTHLNPIKRSIAMHGLFEGDFQMDRRWSQQIIASGLVQNEIVIDKQLYHYRRDPNDSIQAKPFLPMENPPPQPEIGWVTWVT